MSRQPSVEVIKAHQPSLNLLITVGIGGLQARDNLAPVDRNRASRHAWLILAVGTLVYAVAVFQRASLGVAGVQAQHRFGITAAVLSLFSVMQLAVYAALQIPVGVLLDRIGSRRMIAAGAVTMAAGQFLLATAHHVALAVAARVLVGTGDAMTFICVLRLVAVWFPPRTVPVLTQLIAILGQIGQIAAAYPLVALLEGKGWTTSFLVASGLALTMALLAGSFVRNAPPGFRSTAPPVSAGQAVRWLRAAWREPGTRLGLWTHFVTQFSGNTFALLWGYPFLVVGERRSPAEAGMLLTLLVVVGMGIGPLVGHFARRWPNRRSLSTLTITAATVSVWTVVLVWPGRTPLVLLVVLVIVLASNGPGSVMGFDYARTENVVERIGSATGIVNVGGFIASLLTIAGIGIVLSLLSSGGSPSYSLGEFRLAMCVQYLFWAVGLIGVLHNRRRLRAVRGLRLEPAPRVMVRAWRTRREGLR